MDPRLYITALVSMMTISVLFGIGAVVVLSLPSFNPYDNIMLPLVIAASFIFGPIISWYIAPRLRARFWHSPSGANSSMNVDVFHPDGLTR